jgi:hypothetical protein
MNQRASLSKDYCAKTLVHVFTMTQLKPTGTFGGFMNQRIQSFKFPRLATHPIQLVRISFVHIMIKPQRLWNGHFGSTMDKTCKLIISGLCQLLMRSIT